MYSVKYTKQFNGSRVKVHEGLKSEKCWYVCKESQWDLRGYCSRWSLASTSGVVHIFKCFLASGGAVLLVQTGFLKSSQCVVGLDFLLISLQQLMEFMLFLCGNKKGKRAKWSVYRECEVQWRQGRIRERNSFWVELFFSKNHVSSEFWAAVHKDLCWLCWRRNQRFCECLRWSIPKWSWLCSCMRNKCLLKFLKVNHFRRYIMASEVSLKNKAFDSICNWFKA